MAEKLEEVKQEVATANRVLAEVGLATHVLASLGHASMRVPSDPSLFVVKGRGYAIDALHVVQPEQMIVVDVDGNMIDGPPGTSQCYEVKMHSCIYRERPDVQSVVHTHPRFTIIMSLLGQRLKPMCNEGAQLVRNEIPVFPYSRLILSEEDGMGVVKTMGDSKAALLRGHGAVTAGRSLEEAVMTMLTLEEQAKMNWYAMCAAGNGDYPSIPPENMDENAANSAKMGELPHLKEPLARGGARGFGGRPGGVWAYYTGLVNGELTKI